MEQKEKFVKVLLSHYLESKAVANLCLQDNFYLFLALDTPLKAMSFNLSENFFLKHSVHVFFYQKGATVCFMHAQEAHTSCQSGIPPYISPPLLLEVGDLQ